MFIENVKDPQVPRGRGRPRGTTAQGLKTRRRLFHAAVALMAERGYDGATLRDVAAKARVSPALLYRYFPSKQSVVLTLYDELSAEYANAALAMPAGRWRERFLFGLRTSLAVLKPHRGTLSTLTPLLIGDSEEGLFSQKTAFSRARVMQAFERAVADARDAPRPDIAGPLGRLLYLVHLAVLLWWLMDRSPGQRATTGLVNLIEQTLPSTSLVLRFPPVVRLLRTGDALFRSALLPEIQTA
jgi:AcrR family transcriptional regulator